MDAKLEKADVIKWIAGFTCIIVIQITALRYIAIPVNPNISVEPDVILLALFYFSLYNSHNATIIAGFCSGLAFDLLGGGIIGLGAFTKTIIGFILGYTPRKHVLRKLSQYIFVLFLIALSHDFIYNSIYSFNTTISFWNLVAWRSFPSSIYTVLVGIIIFYWVKK
ncbi:rod shape-determining protein MreD [candidate division KSB1 bacterium]